MSSLRGRRRVAGGLRYFLEGLLPRRARASATSHSRLSRGLFKSLWTTKIRSRQAAVSVARNSESADSGTSSFRPTRTALSLPDLHHLKTVEAFVGLQPTPETRRATSAQERRFSATWSMGLPPSCLVSRLPWLISPTDSGSQQTYMQRYALEELPEAKIYQIWACF